MREIQFPYGRGHLTCALEEERLNDVLLSGVESYVPEHDQQELVRLALENPVGQPRLSKLAEGKKNIVVITSDHTRPVPSKITLPLLLEEIRRGARRRTSPSWWRRLPPQHDGGRAAGQVWRGSVPAGEDRCS